MAAGTDRRAQWRFAVTAEEYWEWQVTRPKANEVRCQAPFPTLLECVDDAKQNGYIIWPNERERRSGRRARAAS